MMMWEKDFRYSSILEGRVISESDFLLGLSNTQGLIYDNYLKCTVNPLKVFIDNLHTTKIVYQGKEYYISQLLALIEGWDYQSSFFEMDEFTPLNLLFAMCLNPQFSIIKLGNLIMKRVIDPLTGEVIVVSENELEQAVNDHVDFELQLSYWVTQGRVLAEADSASDLGISEMIFTEAKNRILGKGKKYSWRDFYKGEIK